jgi:hypothetical protein
VKLLTRQCGTWLNRPALHHENRLAKAPFRVEGKEFLLTPGVQSVMNIFTAFGF